MEGNEGWVILREWIGETPHPYIIPGSQLGGVPWGVKREKRWAIHALREFLRDYKHTIVWIEHFNGLWPTYHTYTQTNDGTKFYWMWYIYG